MHYTFCREKNHRRVLNTMGGFNDKEDRYFLRVPDRANNVFFELVRMGFYNPHAISGFEEFLVFEILGSKNIVAPCH